jgi:L-fuconolactonase
MPEFPIVDAHVHLYDLDLVRIGWMAGAPAINRSHGLAEFDAARGAIAVERLVFAEVAVDPGQHLDEARWAQGIADANPRLGAIVAHVPVERGAAIRADLDALAALPAVRGVRRLIQTEADPSLVLDPGFLEGVRLLAAYGFSFDICIKHWQMTYAIELVRRCPEVAFILDHIGKPDIRHGLREPWWNQIAELAGLPNVVCKVSGVITEAGPDWSPATIRPFIERALEVFGPERCMYGSDWTVSELSHRYPDWVAILDDILAAASAGERRAFWRDTATRAYRLA